ncbi:hypothetical protein H8E88_28675 [candidate division KSB1 bacterium]|nr:hypothetical protein [candidate division KSB1 bacterium]
MVSLIEYENFIYSLQRQYPEISASTLIFKRTSASSGQTIGCIYFENEIKLRILETIDFLDNKIIDYSYEVWKNDVKQYWYDCWPHPKDPKLASTHPHHKHIQPNIKHHRIPASELNFNSPNLPFLIQEIIENFL